MNVIIPISMAVEGKKTAILKYAPPRDFKVKSWDVTPATCQFNGMVVLRGEKPGKIHRYDNPDWPLVKKGQEMRLSVYNPSETEVTVTLVLRGEESGSPPDPAVEEPITIREDEP